MTLPIKMVNSACYERLRAFTGDRRDGRPNGRRSALCDIPWTKTVMQTISTPQVYQYGLAKLA